MDSRVPAPVLAAVLLLLTACVSDLERGEALYRQGDLPGALSVWAEILPRSEQFARAQDRVEGRQSLAAALQLFDLGQGLEDFDGAHELNDKTFGLNS